VFVVTPKRAGVEVAAAFEVSVGSTVWGDSSAMTIAGREPRSISRCGVGNASTGRRVRVRMISRKRVLDVSHDEQVQHFDTSEERYTASLLT
jgi:hypothetical protein